MGPCALFGATECVYHRLSVAVGLLPSHAALRPALLALLCVKDRVTSHQEPAVEEEQECGPSPEDLVAYEGMLVSAAAAHRRRSHPPSFLPMSTKLVSPTAGHVVKQNFAGHADNFVDGKQVGSHQLSQIC